MSRAMHGVLMATCACAGAMGLTRAAAAQSVYSYDIFKSAVYTQTGPDAPTDPDFFVFVARIILNEPFDIAPSEVSGPTPFSPLPLTSGDLTTWLYFSAAYTSYAALDAEYPGGLYTFQISTDLGQGENLLLADLIVPEENLLTPSVPRLSAATYAAMQGFDATQDFSGDVGTWGIVPGANLALTFVYARDPMGNVPYLEYFPSTTGVFTIPANTLMAGTSYELNVAYSSRLDQSPGGFGGAIALAAFDRTVRVRVFTSPSCRLDYNLDGSINPDDIGDFITDYFTAPAIPGPGGYAILCPGNEPPYDQGYKAAYTSDGLGQCGEPNPDNLGDWITDYFIGC